MGTGHFSFSREELESLKGLYEASQKHNVDWVLAVSSFPAESKEEINWKARMLAGISLVEVMYSGKANK